MRLKIHSAIGVKKHRPGNWQTTLVLPIIFENNPMNIKSKNRIITIHGIRKSTAWEVTLAVLLAFSHVSRAQQVIMPAPSYPVTPPAVQENEANNEMNVFSAEANAPGGAQETQPFQYGIFTFRPHPFYRFLYGNGILSNTNQAENTVINQISPGFLLDIGRHWTLDYTPTWTLYSNNHFQDTLDHAVTLTGGTSYEDWTFGLSQGFTLTSDPLVETATQTSQQTYSTAIKASYQFNSKMSTDLGLSQNIISADQFESSREWSTLDWLNYQFWPRLDVGVGAGFGYVSMQSGSNTNNVLSSPDMTYEQLQSRVNWRATDKISFQVHAGGEDRQFLDGSGNLLNFVFGAAIQYQPFEMTKISISAGRAVSPSYFGGATENTDFIGGLNQRLLGKLFLDLQGGYHVIKYVASGNTASAFNNREDDLYSASVQLSYPFAQRGTVAAFYQASSNSSTQPGFGYSSTQVGFQISYSY
jgi:hypothetical protein